MTNLQLFDSPVSCPRPDTLFSSFLDERDVTWRASRRSQRQTAHVQHGPQQGGWTLGS